MKEEDIKHKPGVPVIVKDRKSLYKLWEDPLQDDMRELSKFLLWEIALSTPELVSLNNTDKGLCLLSYPNEAKVLLPERCLLDYDVAEEYARINGEDRYDGLMRTIEYGKIASEKAARISLEEYSEACKESHGFLYFELVSKHILSIIQEFDLEWLSGRRPALSSKCNIPNLIGCYNYLYTSTVYLEKLIIDTIILYAYVHNKVEDIKFFNEIINDMISRRRSYVYNEYLENSMDHNNFSVLEYRIADKVKKLDLSMNPYYIYDSNFKNDLYEIIFYGLMALSAVCKEACNKDFTAKLLEEFYDKGNVDIINKLDKIKIRKLMYDNKN